MSDACSHLGKLLNFLWAWKPQNRSAEAFSRISHTLYFGLNSGIKEKSNGLGLLARNYDAPPDEMQPLQPPPGEMQPVAIRQGENATGLHLYQNLTP